SRHAESTVQWRSGTNRRIHGSRGLVVRWDGGPSSVGTMPIHSLSSIEDASSNYTRNPPRLSLEWTLKVRALRSALPSDHARSGIFRLPDNRLPSRSWVRRRL